MWNVKYVALYSALNQEIQSSNSTPASTTTKEYGTSALEILNPTTGKPSKILKEFKLF